MILSILKLEIFWLKIVTVKSYWTLKFILISLLTITTGIFKRRQVLHWKQFLSSKSIYEVWEKNWWILFFNSQSNYCTLIYVFHSRYNNDQIKYLHRLITNSLKRVAQFLPITGILKLTELRCLKLKTAFRLQQ